MNRSVMRRLPAALLLALTTVPVVARADAPTLVPLHSFRVRLTDSTPQGSTSRLVTFVAPDKLRVEIVGSPMVVVAIGRAVWLRGNDAQWHRAAYAQGVDPLSDIRPTFDLARQLKGQGVHYRGLSQLSGAPVKVFDIDPPARRGYEGRTTRFWIGAKDNYLHRIQQRNGAFAFTADYSAWNQPLTVSAR